MSTTIKTFFASMAVVIGFVMSLFMVSPAFAATLQELEANYQAATKVFEEAKVEQKKNADAIEVKKAEIKENERQFTRTQDNIADTTVALYKSERHRNDLVALVLESSSLEDAVNRYENYKRIEEYCARRIAEIKETRQRLAAEKEKLEIEREQIAVKVEETKRAAEEAERKWRDADHSDGAQYHQRQNNDRNCGATSFIVGVNILLHENRYLDNVAVWAGPGFNKNSTIDIDIKGTKWLQANGLADVIAVETYPGDIHNTAQMRAVLEQGKLIVISSGPGSNWQNADGTCTGTGAHKGGHWIVFYYYKDGVFYANDSSKVAAKGAGCIYKEKDMQQWLDGRSNHFATIMSKKD